MNYILCFITVCISVCLAVPGPFDPLDSDDTPEVHSFNLYDARSGNNCVLLQAGIRLHFNYTYGTNKNKTFFLDVPGNSNMSIFTNATGNCSSNVTQEIVIPVGGLEGWNITLRFNQTTAKNKEIILAAAAVNYRMDNETMFPDVKDPNKTYTASQANLSDWHTPVQQGFWCSKAETLDFPKSVLYRLQTYSLKVEAFRAKKDTEFDDAKYTQCDQDNDIGNIVPIAVGAALGALVLIVLIAYLVGRKRNIRGYESV